MRSGADFMGLVSVALDTSGANTARDWKNLRYRKRADKQPFGKGPLPLPSKTDQISPKELLCFLPRRSSCSWGSTPLVLAACFPPTCGNSGYCYIFHIFVVRLFISSVCLIRPSWKCFLPLVLEGERRLSVSDQWQGSLSVLLCIQPLDGP